MTTESSMKTQKLLVALLIIAWSLPIASIASGQTESWEEPDIKVKRIKPADLPSQEESAFPSVLKSKNILPKPTTLEQRRSLGAKLHPMVVEVVAIIAPPNSFQRNPMMIRGHATWISAEQDGSNPILVTNAHWVRKATALYVVENLQKAPQKDRLPRASRSSLNAFQVGGKVKELLRRKDEIPNLRPIEADIHRNLVTLVDDGGKTPLETPPRGLTFFDVEGQSPTNIFGYSPMLGPNARPALFFPVEASEALAFYLQTNFNAALGAPLVTIDASLVAITAMRHPEEAERTLVIPPLALRRYAERVQGLRTSDRVETVEEEQE